MNQSIDELCLNYDTLLMMRDDMTQEQLITETAYVGTDDSLLITPKDMEMLIINQSYLINDSSVIEPASGVSNFISNHFYAGFRNLHSEWGTSSADTHFINYLDSGSNNDNNTYHIEPRFHFYQIGDFEIYSGSNNDETDFTNQSKFHNRQIIKEYIHKNTNYN